MPTANCDDCGKDVSVHAAQCPHCGSPAEHALKSWRRKEEEAEQAEDVVLFNDDKFTVTKSRFITPDRTFAVRNLTSVELSNCYPLAHIFAWVSCPFMLLFFIWCSPVIIVSIFLGLIYGFFVYKLAGRVREVILVTSAGEVKALTDKDTSHCDEIVSALNNAISQH